MKNNLKIKNNPFFIIVLVALNILLILGINYYVSLLNFFNTMITNNSNFSRVLISMNGEYDFDEVKNNISNNKHVISVWSNLDYEGYGKIISIKSDNVDGGIIIESINKNTKEMVNGIMPLKEYELICPSNFFPDYSFVKKYDYFKQINIENSLNENISIKFRDILDTNFKLVGIYDNSYDYTSPNVCYTTGETLSKLNLLSNEQLDKTMIIAELDDINNIDDLYSIRHISTIDKIAEINHSIIDDAIKTITILLIILIIVIIVSVYLIYNRSIISNLRNIGILLVIGLTRNKVKNIYYYNSIKIGLLSTTVALTINLLLSKYFTLILLHKKVGLALMKINISCYSIIIGYFITLLCLFISSYITLKKIDNLEINEALYD